MNLAENISVIICAYTERRWNELAAAVKSVQKQTVSAKEIIVVIDHNPALLSKACKEFAYVTVVDNSGKKGLSGARNTGAVLAQGEVIAFLDDDAIAQPDWIEHLAATYTSSEIVGVGGRIEPYWDQNHPQWFPAEFNWVIGCTYQGMPRVISPVRNMIGANMSVRKHILMSSGGFREAFGCNKNENGEVTGSKWFQHYAGDEETEFCIRVAHQQPDAIWLYTPSAVVQHHVSAQRTRFSYFIWRCYDEGLGKASLSKLVGSQNGLSSERIYTSRVLPKGIVSNLSTAILRGELVGLLRAIAIVLGLLTTVIGYLVGHVYSAVSAFENTSIPALEARSPVEM